MKYPLGMYERQKIRSKTGKTVDEITLQSILDGKVVTEDIKISKETLYMQGQIAKENNRVELSRNFERASELVDVPDEIILHLYNKLRPNRSTKSELMEIAEMLENKYKATQCAKLFKEAAEVYEKRGVLL